MKADPARTAKLLVVLLAFAWGFNWIGAAVALQEVPPWSLRVAGAGIGGAILLVAALITGHDLRIPRGEHVHIMIAGFFNVAAFQIFSSFAQVTGATSRAIMITYSMPIWATLMSRALIGEELTPIRMVAFGLCVSGLTILLWPLLEHGFQPFVFYSLGCALSWAIATVYVKWMKLTIEPLANAAWQLIVRFHFHRRRHAACSRATRACGRCTPSRFWRCSMWAYSGWAWRTSCGGRSSDGCRRSRRRSVR